MTRPLLLGVDPGFANFGYALAWLKEDDTIEPFELGTIQTKPHKELSAAQDLLARMEEVSQMLAWRVHKTGEDVGAVCIEAMSFPRNASSAVKLGASHGMMACFIAEWMPEHVYCRSPQHIRKMVTGVAKKPSEELTHAVLLERYEEVTWRVDAMTKSERPHALDALAAIEAARLEQAFV